MRLRRCILLVQDIAAYFLSENSRVAECVEPVIAQLESESERDAVAVETVAHIIGRSGTKRELKELNYRLESIAPVQVVMMAGNHDYIGEGSNYRDFSWVDNVHFFRQEKVDVIYIEALDTWVYGLSYEHREIKQPLYDKVRPLDKPGYHILLAHGGDEKHIPIQKKELLSAGLDRKSVV